MKLAERFWVRLALTIVSCLLFFSMFMPTLKIGTKENYLKMNAIDYLKGMSLSDEEYLKMTVSFDEKDEKVLYIAMQYRLAEAVETAGYGSSTTSTANMKALQAGYIILFITSGLLLIMSAILLFGIIEKISRGFSITFAVLSLIASLFVGLTSFLMINSKTVSSAPLFGVYFAVVLALVSIVLAAISRKKRKKSK